jgi:hypothetical protein
MRLNIVQLLIIVAGAAAIGANALYPPRRTVNGSLGADREFILSDDFAKTNVRSMGPGVSMFDPVVVDSGTIAVESFAIAAFTVCAVALVAVLSRVDAG